MIYKMVHEEVLVFSAIKLNEEIIEQLFSKIFYTAVEDSESREYMVDSYSGISIFYFKDQASTYSKGYRPYDPKDVYFMQLRDLWRMNDYEIEINLSASSYITIEGKYIESSGDMVAYAKSLPETTWIGLMWIAP